MDIPVFSSKSELFAFLVKNKDVLIAQKKAVMKQSDAIIFQPSIIRIKDSNNKEDNPEVETTGDVRVMCVINTTNVMDSCKDVHLPGLWTKSLQENKAVMHIQEHCMRFDHILSDGKDLKAYTKVFNWSELGYNLPGTTEALVFESLVKSDRNAYMADQYRKGYVKNHSVGMQYVKMIMCMNDENYGAEYEAWNKYYPEVANKDLADEYGYFWAIKEAKVIEGSAVPRGANFYTPTLSVNEQNNQPGEPTDKTIEPVKTTHFDYQYLTNGIKNLKF